MARVPLPQSKIQVRKRRRRTRLSVLAVLVFLLLLGGLAALSHAPFLRVTTIEVVGAKTLASSTIAGVMQQQMEGSYAYSIAKNNIFLYPKQGMMQALRAKYPVLRSVDVHAQNFSTIEAVVMEREAKALWCRTGGTPCFLLDEDGVVYAHAPQFSSQVYVPYTGTGEAALPFHYLPPETFRALFALVDALAQKTGTAVEGVSVDAAGDVRVSLGGSKIIFVLKDATGDIFERFTLALTAAPLAGHALGELEYLDLRFGDKLYYKFKGTP